MLLRPSSFIFFFNDTATTEIYTLSLHDALPIWRDRVRRSARLVELLVRAPEAVVDAVEEPVARRRVRDALVVDEDRKSTRLNSSHANISYAVFCLKKKKKNEHTITPIAINNYHT